MIPLHQYENRKHADVFSRSGCARERGWSTNGSKALRHDMYVIRATAAHLVFACFAHLPRITCLLVCYRSTVVVLHSLQPLGVHRSIRI